MNMEQLLAPKPLADGPNLPEEWKVYKRDFALFLEATNKDGAASKVKCALLLRTIGSRGNLLYESFSWDDEADKKDYDKVIKKFDDYCKPRINLVAKTHSLLTCKQGNRTFDEFLTDLHTIAGLCDLKTMYNRMVLQALILGVESDRIRKKLFELGDTDLERAVELCRREESSAIDYKTVTGYKGEEQAHLVRLKQPYSDSSNYRPNQDNRGGRRSAGSSYNKPQGKANTEQVSNCGNCGHNHPPRSCPAYGKQCSSCKKFNHYAAYCRSRRREVQHETANQVSWNYSSDSETEYVNTITTTIRDRKLLAEVTIKVDNHHIHNIEFQLDTAATCNTLNLSDYDRLGKPALEPTTTKLTLYDQSKCIPLGWTHLLVQEKNGKYTNKKFLVINTNQHSLLSWPTCQEMQLIHVDEQVSQVAEDDQIDTLLTEFDDIFTGLG